MVYNIWKDGYFPWRYPRNWKNNILRFFRSFKWSYQRIVRGFADCDIWNFDYYLTQLIADGLDQLAETTHTYPGNETPEGKTFESWQEYLHETAELFRRSNEDYYYKNPYEDAITKTFDKWTTEKMDDGRYLLKTNYNPKDEELHNKWFENEKEIAAAREADLKEGLKRLSDNFWHLWD